MLNIGTHSVPILRSVEPRPEPGIRIGIDCVDHAAVFQANLRRSLVAPDGPAVEEKKERRRVDAMPQGPSTCDRGDSSTSRDVDPDRGHGDDARGAVLLRWNALVKNLIEFSLRPDLE